MHIVKSMFTMFTVHVLHYAYENMVFTHLDLDILCQKCSCDLILTEPPCSRQILPQYNLTVVTSPGYVFRHAR